MKKINLFLILAGLCVTGLAFAQSLPTVNGPTHPLKPTSSRILADTVTEKRYTAVMGDLPYTHTSKYKFHENNRIDTVTANLSWAILKYSDTDQLLSYSSYAPGRYIPGLLPSDPEIFMEPWEVLGTEHEYDEDGRQLKDIQYGFEGDSSYLWYTRTYNYTMTENGYIVHIISDDDEVEPYSMEYILDNQGRVIHEKNPILKDEYVSDSEGRKFRIGDNYYFYFDGGYSVLMGYYYNWGPNTPLWKKTDYFFQEHGYVSERRVYLMEDETEWQYQEHDEWLYYYKADNPLPNATIEKQPEGTVYAIDGAVIVDTEKAATVNVYSFSGQLVTQQHVSVGINRIALAKGLYIISINGKGYKVAVK